jgi:hypothetical protein
MASTSEEKLYELFAEVSAGTGMGPGIGSLDLGASDLRTVVDNTAALSETVNDVTETMRAAVVQVSPPGRTAPQTANPEQPTPASSPDAPTSTLLSTALSGIPAAGAVASAVSGGGGSIGNTLESIGKSILESGFGILPLIGGLFGLFGGGDSSSTPQLEKYVMPAPIAFQGAESPGGDIINGDYDQMGIPRVDYGSGSTTLAASSAPAGGSLSATGAVAPAPAAASPAAPQITVNVQAMDARSFLDRSSDIAAAVRDAMLSLNPINDVVNDL